MLRRSSYLIARVISRGGACSFHQSSCLEAFKRGRGTGDQGKSSLFSNERRWKDDAVFDALGTIDELNSQLGICRNLVRLDGLFDVCEVLTRVQCCLQNVGAHVATPPDALKSKIEKTRFDPTLFDFVNRQIDIFGDRLPPLKEFILPGGNNAGSALQYARSVCRRAERCLVPLLKADAIDQNALRFLNRLSDLLFVLGRHACIVAGGKEVHYQKPDQFDPLMYSLPKQETSDSS